MTTCLRLIVAMTSVGIDVAADTIGASTVFSQTSPLILSLAP
jgi:hypothetical protein